jgi:hypothetical protein
MSSCESWYCASVISKVRSRVGCGVERFRSMPTGNPGPRIEIEQSTIGFAKMAMSAERSENVTVARIVLSS